VARITNLVYSIVNLLLLVDIIAMEIEKKMGYSIHIFNLQHDAGDRYMNIFFTLGEKTRILKELHFFSRTKHHLTLNQIMKKLCRQKEKKGGKKERGKPQSFR
jgi:hypothetical protein